MRGEKLIAFPVDVKHRGSPPHARGKGSLRDALKAIGGITPACAGKSDWHKLPGKEGEDHPRMRGEKGCSDSVLRPS